MTKWRKRILIAGGIFMKSVASLSIIKKSRLSELDSKHLQDVVGGSVPKWLINFRDWNIKHAKQLDRIAGALGSWYH
jgi:hypothetical protein